MLAVCLALAVSPQARLGAVRRSACRCHRGQVLTASLPPAEDPTPSGAAALEKLRLLESNVEQLEARLAARRPDPASARAVATAATPDVASLSTTADATARPALLFDPASASNTFPRMMTSAHTEFTSASSWTLTL